MTADIENVFAQNPLFARARVAFRKMGGYPEVPGRPALGRTFESLWIACKL